MNRQQRLYLFGTVFLVIGIVCLAWFFFVYILPVIQETANPPETTDLPVTTDLSETTPEPPAEDTTERVPIETTGTDPPETDSPETQPAIDPLTFEEAREANPDVYAWISIPGTSVSYPILQSTDDSFYLTHNERRGYDPYGCVFTESAYTSKDMEDQITVIYGHCIPPAAFSILQTTYSSESAMRTYGTILISTETGDYTYQIFAAMPYDSRHILYNYGYGTPRNLQAFLLSLETIHRLDAYVDEDKWPVYGDKVLVLSTCLRGNDKSQRYLVVAKRIVS